MHGALFVHYMAFINLKSFSLGLTMLVLFLIMYISMKISKILHFTEFKKKVLMLALILYLHYWDEESQNISKLIFS